MVLWLTGLSGAGKSTIAQELQKKVSNSVVLDGDSVRDGLNSDLGYSQSDRNEGNRRLAEVAKLMSLAGLLVIVAAISPFHQARQTAREIIGSSFIEVYVKTPLEVCEARDPKGMYAKARRGELKGFTGIDSPYEPPTQAEVEVDSSSGTPEELADYIFGCIS